MVKVGQCSWRVRTRTTANHVGIWPTTSLVLNQFVRRHHGRHCISDTLTVLCSRMRCSRLDPSTMLSIGEDA